MTMSERAITFDGLLQYAEICRKRSDELLPNNPAWALQWLCAARVLERIVECNTEDTRIGLGPATAIVRDKLWVKK